MSRRFCATAVDIFNHPVVGIERNRAFTKTEAWIWLCANAAWKAHEARTPKGLVSLNRGDVLAAREHLASTWRWGVKQVRNFVDVLESAGQIKRGQQTANGVTVISICNYDKWQDSSAQRASKGPAEGPTEGQQRASKGPHSNKDTKDKQNTNSAVPPNGGDAFSHVFETTDEQAKPADEPEAVKPEPVAKPKQARKSGIVVPETYPAEFEALWLAYPQRGRSGKPHAWAYWEKMPAAHRAKIAGCIALYKAKLARERKPNWDPSPKHFSGFMNPHPAKEGGTYLDFLEQVGADGAAPHMNGHMNGHTIDPEEFQRKKNRMLQR